MKTSYYVAIEGCIGVGKTSLAKLLTERLEAKLILEKFEDNPFLPDFYKNPERYAFQTQLFFLLSRYRQQIDLQQTDLFYKCIVSDYIFAKDRLFATLNLSEKEISLYDNVASLLEKNITFPNLVIFLQSDTERLMENIRKRGRNYEKQMDWKY